MARSSSPTMVLDFEDFEDLESLIEKSAHAAIGAITGWEIEFMTDIARNYTKAKERIRLTGKQWEVLKRVGNKLGVDLQH
jgi:hypothetical protein